MATVSQTVWAGAAIALAIGCSGCNDKPNASPALPPAVPVAKSDTTSASPAPAAKRDEGKPTAEQIMTLSPQAAEQVRLRCKDLKPDAVVIIGVAEGDFFRFKNGGKKRYRYTMKFDDNPRNLDQYFSMESQGLTILVDYSSAEFLRGAEMIWIEAGGKGGFKFQNPNEVQDDEAEQPARTPEPEAVPNSPAGPTPK